jgi:hypothetical protein
VVILADIEAHTAEPGAAGAARHGLASSVEHDVLVDANAILTYQCVKRLNEKCHVLIEIVRDQNIHFLDAENFRVDYKLSPYFASGTIFTSSLFDTLLVQSFYNPDIINVVNKLVGAELKTGPNGDIPVTRNNQEGETNATLQNGMQNPFSYHSSKLYQMSLPEGLESRTYGALFKKLAKTGKIPLGLIRGIFGHMNQGSRGNFLRYSFTNPPADCEIFSCDSVVVLSQNPPSQYIAGKPLSNAQMLREIHAQENLRLAKKKGNGDSYLNHVNREVKRMVDSHTHFKDCINSTRAKILSGLSSLHMEARAIEKALLKAGGGFSGTDRKPDENKSILQFKETSGSGSGGGGSSSSGGSGAQMDHLPDADAHPAAAIKKPTKGEKLANTLDTMTGRLVRGSGL